uniref:Regulatory protein zeste n=1 Tax=Heliothis virescens TaxID=7102 RepID=A0A2A4JGY7_HELVI
MDRNKRQRGVYVTARQKKKLIELMTKHPELISCRVTQDFNYKDSQQLWHSIANECNSIPGAKKSWRQWRKTWQDLRSKTKKRQAETNGELPSSVVMLTPAEQEALGLKNVSSTTNQMTEFIPLEDHNDLDSFDNVVESNPSYSDAESIPEEKVFINPDPPKVKIKKHKNNSKHTTTCAFNCDMLAVTEQRKIQIKEDYLNFKKDYLRQKLKLLKEQTEALKSIANELCVNK